MRGIILAGGKGTRLLPATRITNKHLIPILNRPMIEYPLGTLKMMGITDIMIVSGGDHIGHIAQYLGDGQDFGVELTYRVQRDAGGIAQALGIARDFAHGGPVAVILGDNVFDNEAVMPFVEYLNDGQAHLFTKEVKDPERFGVLVMEGATPEHPLRNKYKIVEKPKEHVGNEAVTGLYVYPAEVFDIIKTLQPSGRGELEITDVNNAFIDREKCVGHRIGQAFWSDAGTPESLFEVTQWAYGK